MRIVDKLKKKIFNHPQAIISLLIFATCLFIYLANGRNAANSDTLPNSLLAFNWLEHHTLTFDNLQDNYRRIPWFLIQAPNGHLTSTYPIGTAIITFPLYFLFSIYLKLVSFIQTGNFAFPITLPDVAEPGFKGYMLGFQKLAASIATATSVVLFYQISWIKFGTGIGLICSFIFAFATSTWVMSSQALWQHTASNLALISLLFCLVKANRQSHGKRKVLLLIAGIFCGLLPGIRPTSALFSIAAIVYAVLTYRREAIFLLLGLPSALLSLSWNFYYFGFGNWMGGYSKQFANQQSAYYFNIEHFIDGFGGLLISPSRGLFIFSPILLFAIPGAVQIFKHRTGKDDRLLIFMLFASIILFLQYCFYHPWSGNAAINYGPRFLIDIFPILVILIGYFLTEQARTWTVSKLRSLSMIVFMSALLWSTGVQAIGAFGNVWSWEYAPSKEQSRLWDWHDNEIKRVANSLLYKLIEPIEDKDEYVNGMGGMIEQLFDKEGNPLSSPLQGSREQKLFVRARVRNTGKQQWFGYLTGMGTGETRIKVRLYDQQGQQRAKKALNTLFVSSNPQPGEQAEAIGFITFPRAAGTYRLTCNFLVRGIGDFPNSSQQPAYVLEVNVQEES